MSSVFESPASHVREEELSTLAVGLLPRGRRSNEAINVVRMHKLAVAHETGC
jgi:hypothetical protein